MVADLEEQLRVERAATASNGVGADLQHLVEDAAAVREDVEPNPEQTMPAGQEDSIEDQLKQ